MNSRSTFLLFSIFFLIIILTVVQLLVSNKLATSGVILSSLRQEVLEKKQENEILKTEIAKASSLVNIASQAASLGFVKNNNPLAISTSQTFALR